MKRSQYGITRFSLLVFSLLLLNSGSASAQAQTTTTPPKERTGGSIGAGIILGDINGLSFKLWDGHQHGLQVRLGSAGLNTFALTAHYAYHFRPVAVPDNAYSLPFYIGGGARFKAEGGPTLLLEGGLEAVAGMSIMVPELPVELFFEIRPKVVLFTPTVSSVDQVWLGAGIEGGMGVNYYF